MTPDNQFLKAMHIKRCVIPEPSRNEPDSSEHSDSFDLEVEQIGCKILMMRDEFEGIVATNHKLYADCVALRSAATGWERESAEMQAKRSYWRTIALIFGAAILVGTIVQLSWR